MKTPSFPITSIYKGRSGETYEFAYYNTDSLEGLPRELMTQVVIMAFREGKLLIVNNITKPGYYSPVGGGLESYETPEECLMRELKEESNMEALEFKLVGYQISTNKTRPEAPLDYQLRYAARVQPIGPFTEDPAGDVTELIEINPADYKKYFDWGETGDVIMRRARELIK